jgi:hypothetical protein
MNEDDKELLISTSERAKSNTHQIEEIKADIKEIKEDNKAIYELTYSVKGILERMTDMKDNINDIKQGQENLSKKVDDLEKKPYKEFEQTKHDIKVKVAVSIGGSVILGLIAYICGLIGSGAIKL